jgi:hypothetical protein
MHAAAEMGMGDDCFVFCEEIVTHLNVKDGNFKHESRAPAPPPAAADAAAAATATAAAPAAAAGKKRKGFMIEAEAAAARNADHLRLVSSMYNKFTHLDVGDELGVDILQVLAQLRNYSYTAAQVRRALVDLLADGYIERVESSPNECYWV